MGEYYDKDLVIFPQLIILTVGNNYNQILPILPELTTLTMGNNYETILSYNQQLKDTRLQIAQLLQDI